MSEELKEKLRKELRVFQDYTASWGYPMNSEVHRTGLDKAEAKLLELCESYAKEREIEGQKLYTQSEVDRLIREAVIEELNKHRKNYIVSGASQGSFYKDPVKFLDKRIESLSKQKEGSK